MLVAHTLPDIQELFDRFADAARRFGLTVSLEKTEVMLQSYPTNQSATATVMAGDTILTSASKFCYLESYLSNTVAMDYDITARIAKGCTAFGGLQHRLSSSQPSCLAPSAGPCTGSISSSSNNSTCAVFAKLPGSDGRTVYQILVCWRCVAFRVLKHSCYYLSSIGSVTQSECFTSGYRNKPSSDNCKVVLSDTTKTALKSIYERATWLLPCCGLHRLTGVSGDSAAQMPYRLSRRGTQQLLSPNGRPGRTLLLQEGR